MSNALIKSAASHRRLARAARARLRAAVRAGIDTARIVSAIVSTIDANRRCAAADFAAGREVVS